MIVLNGEERPMPAERTIVGLLLELEIKPEQQGIAVAVNSEVVSRGAWGSACLQDGDHVELVRAVQGG